MKLLILLTLLLPAIAKANIPYPKAATGFELGVSRLSAQGKSIYGTSWVYHFEFIPDKYLRFFGQAGAANARDGSDVLKQNNFAGGLQLAVLPLIELRLGLAMTVSEIEIDGQRDRERELGPLAGLVVDFPSGVFKLGTTATLIRTNSMTNGALRVMGLIVF